jgi:hypothetical protein
MTIEKTNATFNVQNSNKLPDYDREIRKQRVTRTRYFDHAVKYIKGTNYSEDAKSFVINHLSGYPSEAIDGIFHKIDSYLRNAELDISKTKRRILDAFTNQEQEQEVQKEFVSIEQSNVDDLYDSILQDEAPEAPEAPVPEPEIVEELPKSEENTENSTVSEEENL